VEATVRDLSSGVNSAKRIKITPDLVSWT
jgi:hypothetical protein